MFNWAVNLHRFGKINKSNAYDSFPLLDVCYLIAGTVVFILRTRAVDAK